MIKIEIKNFRGISSASFLVDKIAMLGGRNAAGKSSLAQATAALLTGQAIPVRGVSKSTAGQLVRSGTAAGSAKLTDGENTAEISWPKAAVKTTGQPPQATEFAAGLSCIINMNAKDRAAALSQYLNAEPTREDFDKELAPLDLPEKLLDQLWDVIEQTGWDGAHNNCKEKGAKLKGQWEQITGANYGSKIAENWIPDGWEPELDGLSEESLQADLNDARQVFEAAIATEAIDDNRRAEIESKADQVQGLKETVAELTDKASQIDADRDQAFSELKKLPLPDHVDPLICPECETKLQLSSGKLTAATVISAAELKKRADAIEKAKSKTDGLTNELNDTRDELSSARQQLKDSQAAAVELDQMSKAAAGDSSCNIEQARTHVQHAEERLEAWTQKTQADHRQMNIALNAELIKALAPTGIRQKKLAEALDKFNHGMAEFSEISRFGTVELDSELNSSLNGTPYHLLSKSERWRVRITLQLAMAGIDKSSAVVIDGADILVNRELRNGLIGLLQMMDIPAVVTMAMQDVSWLPDLAAAGLGNSYWVDGGVLMSRDDALKGGK